MHASEALKMELFFKKEVKKQICFLYFQTMRLEKELLQLTLLYNSHKYFQASLYMLCKVVN